MAKLVVVYKKPKDPAHFDDYYFNKHVPMAWKMPGMRKYDTSKGPVKSFSGEPGDYYLLAIMEFDSLAAIDAALTSPEGQAAAADVPNYATGGAEIYFFDTKEV